MGRMGDAPMSFCSFVLKQKNQKVKPEQNTPLFRQNALIKLCTTVVKCSCSHINVLCVATLIYLEMIDEKAAAC